MMMNESLSGPSHLEKTPRIVIIKYHQIHICVEIVEYVSNEWPPKNEAGNLGLDGSFVQQVWYPESKG